MEQNKVIKMINTNSENEFKKIIWSEKGKNYLKELFTFKNKEFFTPKSIDSNNSNKYYISNESIKDWAAEMTKKYDNKPDYNLFRTLLEVRGGQYSNGTLFSSSRLVSEIFANKNNRVKLLNLLYKAGVKDTNPNQYKWYLEYLLPINHVKNSIAHLDLVAENENYFIGLECKMKEIYSDRKSDNFQEFKLSYRKNKKEDVLKEFENKFKFVRINKKYRMYLHNEDEQCNFYYKQQICHLLGMRNHKDIKKKEFIFLNLVFDPTVLKDCTDNIKNKFNQFKKNENEIGNLLKKYFENKEKGNIKYFGLINQDIVKIDNRN